MEDLNINRWLVSGESRSMDSRVQSYSLCSLGTPLRLPCTTENGCSLGELPIQPVRSCVSQKPAEFTRTQFASRAHVDPKGS